ncbi:kinase-like protein [Aulographum hederae CBS 113979]|uniref:Kinase-like protein n=1 Tax=Aulographum hederae CBS 113979 TaxID=1176131 RepID=A0A6G1GYW9_9PEZI|nr:kinase-like protein [Aulographum hederae CBS 113979]
MPYSGDRLSTGPRPKGQTKYRIIKEVGKGGEGTCFIVEKKSDGTWYVCKISAHDTIVNIMKADAIKKNRGIQCFFPKNWCPLSNEANVLLNCFPAGKDNNGKSLLSPNVIWLEEYGPEWSSSSGVDSRALMEYCNGGDLYGLLWRWDDAQENFHYDRNYFGGSPRNNPVARRGLPQPAVWHIFFELACALAYMHQGRRWDGERRVLAKPLASPSGGYWPQVIHRDIKPENIFIRDTVTPRDNPANQPPGYPKIVLADFGHAKPLYPPTGFYQPTALIEPPRRNDNCGTTVYWPPEMPLRIHPKIHPSPASDVYQIGLVVYELALGENLTVKGERFNVLGLERAMGREFAEIWAKCVRKEAGKRWKADKLVEALADGHWQWTTRMNELMPDWLWGLEYKTT